MQQSADKQKLIKLIKGGDVVVEQPAKPVPAKVEKPKDEVGF